MGTLSFLWVLLFCFGFGPLNFLTLGSYNRKVFESETSDEGWSFIAHAQVGEIY